MPNHTRRNLKSVVQLSSELGRYERHALPCDLEEEIDNWKKRLNAGESNAQLELDCLMPCQILFQRNSDLVRQLPWSYFRLKPEHAFGTACLFDIGGVVRDIVLQKKNNSLIFRLLQYSLPYVKHNRLSFIFNDKKNDVCFIPEIFKIVIASCLGCFGEHSKRPVWGIRLQLIELLYECTRRSDIDAQFQFLQNYMSLMRLSLIEYFVYFCKNYMPAEMQILSVVFGLSLPINEMFNSFVLIVDCFRQNCLQGDVLNWAEVGTHSGIAVEKCNRVCKGKTKIVDRKVRFVESVNVVDEATLDIAMNCPNTVDAKYLCLFDRDIDVVKAVAAIKLRQNIKRYQLPHNITKIQEQAALERLQTNTMSSYHRLFVYMCLRCMHVTGNMKKNMRIKSSHIFVCNICKSNKYILKVNTIGSIVQIGKVLYYSCNQCENIHEWSCSGMNFSHCERSVQSNKTAPLRTCSMCTRTVNLTSFNVLNEDCGIINRLLLCNKHMPLQQHVSSIYNTESFMAALRIKQRLYGNKNTYKII